MIKDCIDYAKAYQECQKHGSIQQIPATELHSIIKPWPFKGWALDLIGLIHPPSSRQHKFILVAIDYFTKWVEAIPLVEAGQTEIIDFIEENIVHQFGIPQTLSTDQGTMFTGQRIKNFVASRNISMVTSTPYYAQANSQVEAANKILIVLPLEINLNTLRVSKQNDLPVDDYWNAMFDELNELDSERILKSRFLGKWSHSWEGPFQVIGKYSGNTYQIKDIESGKSQSCYLSPADQLGSIIRIGYLFRLRRDSRSVFVGRSESSKLSVDESSTN
nr:uncharacterized protein LOC112734891 [Arachis hypogaea]